MLHNIYHDELKNAFICTYSAIVILSLDIDFKIYGFIYVF